MRSVEDLGTAQFPRELFERLLGDRAFRVWRTLCVVRATYGTVTITVPGIARAKGFERYSERTVQRALARLRLAGLVRDLGYAARRGEDGAWREVYVRKVFGELVGRELVLVPVDVWPRVHKLPPTGASHGGRRPGAGRRKSSGPGPDSAELQQRALREKSSGAGPDSAELLEGDHAPLDLDLGNQAAHGPPESSGVPTRSRSRSGGGFVFSASQKRPALARGPFSVSGKTEDVLPPRLPPAEPPRLRLVTPPVPAPPPAPTPPEIPSKKAPPESVEPRKGGGGPPPPRAEFFARLAAQAASRPIPAPVYLGEYGLPPHPTGSYYTYTVPPPPRIPRAMEDEPEEQLAFVARWYRAAVESRLGRCPPLRLAGQTRRLLEDARDVFWEHDISPGAWTAWALDRVLLRLPRNARRRFMPSMKTLLSPKTLTESRWQYREVVGEYATATVMLLPEAKDLLARLRTLPVEVRRMAPEARTPEAIAALMARVFPRGYRVELEEVRAATARVDEETLALVKMAHWVWPLPNALRGLHGEEGR